MSVTLTAFAATSVRSVTLVTTGECGVVLRSVASVCVRLSVLSVLKRLKALA